MPPCPAERNTRRDLRRQLRRLRRELAAARPDAGKEATQHLQDAGLPLVRVFAAYLPVSGEIDCGPLALHLMALGADRLLPHVLGEGRMRFLSAPPGGRLEPDASGLPAPPQDAEEKRPDLVIAPLLAFDRFGGRLGQGGGHYDRVLAELRRTGPVFVLGLAFAGQEVDRLDLEPHDQPLDAVLTEAGYRRLPQA
ncbi:MAG: 5-formyltetrahydrofolate cyclo-ligase [Phenylobacterium sp.]